MISRAFTCHAILLLLLLSSVAPAGAQEEKSQFRPRFMIGPTAGVNLFSDLSAQGGAETQTGYDGGIIRPPRCRPLRWYMGRGGLPVRGWREVPELFPDKYYRADPTLRQYSDHDTLHDRHRSFQVHHSRRNALRRLLSESNRNNFLEKEKHPLRKCTSSTTACRYRRSSRGA